ncbi:tyrosine-type recombinase/integrase [Enterocloster lavalensis]|uniref:tyrosine-type recombinase/integrase n=1 Tax=Enterocloster lavalensis TaxID=460384 RepID=UPI002F3E33FA
MGTPRTLRTEKNAAISDGELSLLLDQFHRYMAVNSLSDNTISAYLWGVRAFFACYSELNQNNASLYKADLMERYRPQTVNMRIRALNCFLKSQDIHDYKIPSVRLQQKSFIDHVISQADYEYLKNRLWEDEQYTFYFIVRFIAATGVRVSELVALVFTDVQVGYRDLYSKGNKTRRIYIPSSLQKKCLDWLEAEGRRDGPLFISRLGRPMTVSGIRKQLKTFAIRYHLDPEVMYPHSFRHRFAKNFIENGGDIAFLSDLLGHDSIETTHIYLRRTSTEQAILFNRVVDW